MTTKILYIFRDLKQFKLFAILCLATLFNFALIAVRLHHLEFSYTDINSTRDFAKLRGTSTFFFLIWNLFLAWVPYWISLSLEGINKRFSSKVLIGTILFVWLLFFPNAPYILTDLLHLREREPIPYWYDLMVLLSFAWTGLMLGLASLYEVQVFLQKRFSKIISWLAIFIILPLSGLGIYIGRYLRWNSWDILTNPIGLFQDLIAILLNPGDFYGSGIALLSTIFLTIAYLTFVSLAGFRRHPNNNVRT